MKPKAPIPPKPKMSEEERKEQMTRAFLQKRASLAEGILFAPFHSMISPSFITPLSWLRRVSPSVGQPSQLTYQRVN